MSGKSKFSPSIRCRFCLRVIGPFKVLAAAKDRYRRHLKNCPEHRKAVVAELGQ